MAWQLVNELVSLQDNCKDKVPLHRTARLKMAGPEDASCVLEQIGYQLR
jgi:hypothetical protein